MRHHTISTNGINLHLAETGDGPAVVFCHGFPAIWSSWKSQMQAVAEAGWRAIAVDMRGYGGSDAPEAAELFTPLYTVGDLVGMLDHFEIETAVIVGHDFGATTAWNAAMLRPDRFRAVFGISVPFGRPATPGFLDILRNLGKDDFYMFRQMRPESDAEWADAGISVTGMIYWTSGHAPDETRWDPFDPEKSFLRPAPEPMPWMDQDYLAEAIASLNETGFHGALNYYRAIDPFAAIVAGPWKGATIAQPSGFLTGTLDGVNMVRPATEEGLRDALPGLRSFTMLDGVGHWPQFEAPEATNAALLDFLASL